MKRKALRELKLGKPYRLTAGLTNHEHPAISPDGRLIAYYAGPFGSIQVSVADMQGRFAWAVSPQGGNNTQPAWHPSGTALAFRHQHDNASKWELWEAKLEGDARPQAILADPQWHYKHPYYDPAGARMTYFTDEGSPGVYHIWILDLATGERKQVTFGNTQMHCHPVFSPDGGRIVYHAYEGTDETKVPAIVNLYELDIASGAVRELTTGTDQYKHPFYIDNTAITFHHERNSDGRRQLCAMHLKSREIVRLTDGKANDKHPCPWIDRKGQAWVAWASKKLGTELAAEAIDYDIFLAPLG